MTVYISATDVGVCINEQVLLAPVNLGLSAGRTLAVTGSNGSGKTTLLRLLSGQTTPSTGTVTVAGEPADDRDPAFRRRLAALFGLPPLARNLTLREHMTLVATTWGFPLEEAEVRADELLTRFDIARLHARFPHELSSGQTQLFALALTLTRPFEVLLLDEPEQRLDADRLVMVGEVLNGLVADGATIIMASHSPALVAAVADEVLELSESDRADSD